MKTVIQKALVFITVSIMSSFAFAVIIHAGSSYKGKVVLPVAESNVSWSCDGSRCSYNANSGVLKMQDCVALVRKVGKITYFSSDTQRWSPVGNAKKLQECNQYSR